MNDLPEPLVNLLPRYDSSNDWSRRIDREYRLVCQYEGGEVLVYSCRYHYGK